MLGGREEGEGAPDPSVVLRLGGGGGRPDLCSVVLDRWSGRRGRGTGSADGGHAPARRRWRKAESTLGVLGGAGSMFGGGEEWEGHQITSGGGALARRRWGKVGSMLSGDGSMHGPHHRREGATTIERMPRRPGPAAKSKRERGAVSKNRERRLHGEGERKSSV